MLLRLLDSGPAGENGSRIAPTSQLRAAWKEAYRYCIYMEQHPASLPSPLCFHALLFLALQVTPESKAKFCKQHETKSVRKSRVSSSC